MEYQKRVAWSKSAAPHHELMKKTRVMISLLLKLGLQFGTLSARLTLQRIIIEGQVIFSVGLQQRSAYHSSIALPLVAAMPGNVAPSNNYHPRHCYQAPVYLGSPSPRQNPLLSSPTAPPKTGNTHVTRSFPNATFFTCSSNSALLLLLVSDISPASGAAFSAPM